MMSNNMEQIKKRRNSILKKTPANDDDTTGDVTTKLKRRISFSGKKSVKEFIAGEEEATIWGTSYEESAECLKGNSTESGLVNVHEKRIVLRNRRVVVEPNSGTKRHSKKKVHIAENDKENIFHQPPEIGPPHQGESIVTAESPLTSEHTLARSQLEDVKNQIAPGTVDRLNKFSNTFDFINCTATTNKTILIENSVEVSLNDDELQMLKFRVPVTATDVNPNLSVDSLRDGASPNMFSRSILMTEEDLKLLKMMRGKKGLMGVTETQVPNVIANTSTKQDDMDMDTTLTDTNKSEDKKHTTLHISQFMNESVPDAKSSKGKTLIKVVDMEAGETQHDKNLTLKGGFMNLVRGTEGGDKKRVTMNANQSMDVTQCQANEVKNLKRKTITKPVNMSEASLRVDCAAKSHKNVMDTSSMDINSPMRKKPMHDTTSKPMDITNVQSTSQREQIRRQTIHFESAAVEESLIFNPMEVNTSKEVAVNVSMDVPRNLRQTMQFEEDRINEIIYPNGEAFRPAVAVEDDQYSCNISMELSVYDHPEKESIAINPPSSVEEQKTTTHRQTVHFAEHEQMDFTFETSKRRQSIHTPDDMIEDSPKSEKSSNVLPHEPTKSYDDLIKESPKPIKSIMSSKSNVTSRQTIYDSTDIIEVPIPITSTSLKQRQSIYTPTDILEDSLKATKPTQTQNSEIYLAAPSASKIDLKIRQSVYTPANIVEDSPVKMSELRKSNILSQTIHASDEVIEEAPVQLQIVTAKNSNRKRESIYTPADIIEDSPKSTRTSEATEPNFQQRQITYTPANVTQVQPSLISSSVEEQNTTTHRQTVHFAEHEQMDFTFETSKRRQSIHTPDDMIEESPKSEKSSHVLHHEPTKSYDDMIEESPKPMKSIMSSKSNVTSRQTIYDSTDIIEVPILITSTGLKQRQSIYTPTDILEDSLKATKPTQTQNSEIYLAAPSASKIKLKIRQSVYTPANIVEDSPVKMSELCKSNILSQTIHASDEVIEEAPVQLQIVTTKNSDRKHESIYTPADTIEDSPKSTRTSEATEITYTPADVTQDQPSLISTLKGNSKERQTIYTTTDMDEDSPKAPISSVAKQRQSNYTPADMTEDSPKSGQSSTSAHKSTADYRQSIYTPSDMIEESPKTIRSSYTDTVAKHRQSIYTSSKMNEESLQAHESPVAALKSTAQQHQSIYIPSNIIEDLPKSTHVQPIQSAVPKVIVKHLNLQQGLSGNEATLRILKNQLAKPKPNVEIKADDSVIDMSVFDELPTSSNKTNFHKIYEEMFRGEAKVFTEERKEKISLFDLLESKPTEEVKFDLFPKKRSAIDFLNQPTRNSMKDYTMELSLGKSLRNQRDSEYTMNLSLGKVEKPRETITNAQNTMRDSSTTTVDLSLDQQQKSPKALKDSRRQTLLFNDDLEEEHISEQKVFPKISSKRYTTHFHQDLDLDDEQKSQVTKPSKKFNEKGDQQIRLFNETKRNTAENAVIASKSIRRTVYFQENNNLDESVQPAQDDSTMNLSMVHEPNSQVQQATLPLPRRLTILDDLHVDIEESPQKITARKSSFSRTLNFNAIPTTTSKCQTQTDDDMDMSIQNQATAKVIQHSTLLDDDSPLCSWNAKSKSNETTAEIDRSLAEYLKAEIAAAQFRTNSADMSMNVSQNEQKGHETVYYDAEDEQQSKSRRQTSYELVNIFEESGMQPLQRRQTMIDSKAVQPSRIELQTHSEVGRNIKPTETQTEEGGNSMDMDMQLDMPTEKPFQTKETLTRKTIHFTNENAVDESFFDEKQSKPVSQNQKNRQTIFFNDSKNAISEIDVTLSENKVKATGMQKLKEILQESTMLFTQSKLLKPSDFDNKRSTIYFACKDNSMEMTTANESMECESPDDNVDSECTPPKSIFSKSRIPQLIGSAKKLQSMKKSMEFIQQELPNLGYPVHKDETPEESINTIETRLHESHIPDIPRRATTFKPKLFEESFETTENPRRATPYQPNQLQNSFDTIEITRRATTFQRNETLYLPQNEVDNTNMSQKSLYIFEDAPITISDVSTFFAQKPIPTSGETDEVCSPNTTEALCNLTVNGFAKEDHLPKSSDSEDTTHNFDKFKKRYVKLTCDSIVLSDTTDDIEKTHLSLVNTLDEQSEMVHSACPQETGKIESETDKIVATVPSPSEPLKPISSVCRKCKRHRLSTTQNETTIGSFLFEPVPEYEMDLAALKELATKPRISDIANVWQQKMRESDSFNISDVSRSVALDDQDSVDDFIAALNSERLIATQLRKRKEIKREACFISRVREQMQSKKSNWILNELLLTGGVLKFTHTRIRTFAILISFTQKDPRGTEVNFNEIQLVPNVLHSCQWTPFDYALHYQLLVELPFDLRKLCPRSENLFELLEHVEEVTHDVLKTGKDMLYLVLTSPASLIRESSGRLYIRKYVRTKAPQNEVKRTEFQIEVRNIKKLSYESIAVPPLYEFDEKIELLPVGQDFLRIFLADPMRYVKT